jgi:hypothetical protein
LSWSAALNHELIRKKQENMRVKKGRAAKQKRWEMKEWERMRKFALSRIFVFTL